MALEDGVGDVVGKAMRGRGVSEDGLAKAASLTLEQVQRFLNCEYTPDDQALLAIGEALGLRGESLIKIARNSYTPHSRGMWPNAAVISSPYSDFVVNTYLVWDAKSRQAVLFDTGTDFQAIKTIVEANGLTVELLAITHTHGDHIEALESVINAYHPRIIASEREPVAGADFVADGDHVSAGALDIEVRETEGHSPGGLTFIVSSPDAGPDLAVAGDAIFAGSAGGALVSYESLHRNVREKILSLPDDTLILPGHGPVTTVGQEKENNPFAPAAA